MANDITILSCPICNYPKLREYGNGIHQCDICETYFDKDENVVLTEQEYLQTCNTEQLAEELLAWWFDGANTYSQFGLFKWEIDEAKEKIVEWLKQPHTTMVRGETK